MKHQYFGDVNDYRKYGLLRCIQRESGLRLAVCWMLTPDDARTDGRFISYLAEPAKWRQHDPELFDFLAEGVPSGRNLRHVEDKQILRGSILIGGTVPDDRRLREAYFRNVLRAFGAAAIVFFDPDNGIEVRSCPPGRKNSSKYLAWSEIITTYRSGRSVLIYQHFPRRGRNDYVLEIANGLIARTEVRIVTCFRTANVAFFLISHPPHERALIDAARKVETIWKGQIDVSHHTRSPGGSGRRLALRLRGEWPRPRPRR
jgi:hypothetical protein